MATQNELIAGYLKSGQAITPLEALYEFGCFRLGARIYDLKQQGMDIESKLVTVRGRLGGECHVASYRLAGQQELF